MTFSHALAVLWPKTTAPKCRNQSTNGIRWSCLLYMSLFIACLLFQRTVHAQPRGADGAAAGQHAIHPLQIGDTIPEALWQLPLQVVNHPDGSDTIRLHHYRDKKLIILDFWATWCLGCVRSLQKAQPLQQDFQDDIQILPVTVQSLDEIQHASIMRDEKVFSIIGDQQLKSYFPHRSIPHLVWISQGKVLYTTYSEALNPSIIRDVLEDKPADIVEKYEDLDFDISIPLVDTSANNYATLLPYLPGLKTQDTLILSPTRSRWVLINETLPSLIYKSMGLDNSFPRSQIVYQQVDIARFYPPKHLKNNRWKRENSYAFEWSSTLPTKPEDMQLRLKKEVEKQFDIKIRLKKKTVPCIIVRDLDTTRSIDPTLRMDLAVLCNVLNRNPNNIPIVNEVTGRHGVNIFYLEEADTIQTVLQKLRDAGVVASIQEKEIETLLITHNY